ncbi:hypothetical protein CLAFUW4_05086 [Fulvia fulva]|nr:hypothetical protein CLAFUR4_05072 [Fulvia fulva]WPV13715.1 hypothetical protein CLAFUW4_05086 [Fulvia fulva]
MPAIKRERPTPLLNPSRGGGGGGGSSSSPNRAAHSPQSANSKRSNNMPAWVFMKHDKIRHYLRCDDAELKLLEVVNIYMREPDYNGSVLLGKDLCHFDRDGAHRKRLWSKVEGHDPLFRELLRGERWPVGQKPVDFEEVVGEVKRCLKTRWGREREARRAAKEARRRGERRERERESSAGEVISLLSEDEEDGELVMSGGLG